ncbi:Polyadenylate-binding protein 2 [Nymphaea thermarum]|nr:Polyadenylate-binding protein 2 [Nymphaea thermarum]
MEEDEHEVYGGDIPDMEGDMEVHQPDVDMARPDDDDAAAKELDEMKKRLKEMEEEAAALREMQAKVEKEMGAVQDPASAAAAQAGKEEADSRSVFVGNVDYSCTPEEVQQHFQSCGTVNRVTILTDKFGQPKGFAYVEFLEMEAVQNALLLNESELHGRQLKVHNCLSFLTYKVMDVNSPHTRSLNMQVLAKRTNVPGMKAYRGRRFNPYLTRYRRPFMPPPYFYSPYGYGKFPRYRRPMRYRPYY